MNVSSRSVSRMAEGGFRAASLVRREDCSFNGFVEEENERKS